MDFISKLLDLNKITAKTAFIVLLISAGLMFLPVAILHQLDIATFKKEYGKYFGFALLASSAFLIVALLHWFQQKISQQFDKRRSTRAMLKAIQVIDFAEVKILREFVIHSQKTLDMPIDDPVVAGMLNKGLLRQVSNMGQMSREGFMMAVAVNEQLASLISKKILGLPDGEPTKNEADAILNQRPDWAKSVTARKNNNWYW